VQSSCQADSLIPVIVTSQADANELSTCTFVGDVTVQGNEITTLTFNGLSQIFGNLRFSSCGQLSKISAPDLTILTGNFTLFDLPELTILDFPALRDGTISNLSWTSLPSLTDVTLKVPGGGFSGDIIVKDTGLSNFSFLYFNSRYGSSEDFYPTSLRTLTISGNRQATSFNFPGLSNCTQLLIFSNNGSPADIALPDLEEAWDLSFNAAGRIKVPALKIIGRSLVLSDIDFNEFSAPNLTQIRGVEMLKSSDWHYPREGGLVIQNTHLQRFSAPKLITLKGDCVIEDNNPLELLNLPQLETLGPSWTEEFVVRNNPKLMEISFPKLANSGANDLGNVTIFGPVSKYVKAHEYVPDLTYTYFQCLDTQTHTTSK
jgi:hypothetical protein